MKRFSTLILMLTALLALPVGMQAEEATAVFDFENNTMGLPVGEGAGFTDGSLTAPVTVGEVTLTSVQGDAFYPAIMMKDNNGVVSLNVYKNGAIKFNAAEGRAIVKVVATMKSKTFALTPSSGSIADNTWTGNATEVTFAAGALYSFLKIEVTTDAENSETVKPAAESFDVEAADIAAFNAVEDGKVVKLTLNNARVNGKFNGYYVEDASGATVVKGIDLEVGTALNGYIIGTKSTDNNIDYMGITPVPYEPQLTVLDGSAVEATPTTLVGTVKAVNAAGTQANYGRLITLENVTISGGGQNKTLTDANGNTITARDYMGVLPADYTWPEQATKITGIVIYYMTGWFIMPISAEAIEVAGQQPTSVTFNFASSTIRENIGTALTDTKGYFYNEVFTAENVTLQITSGSAPSRIYVDNNRGQNLVTYKDYTTLTFRAPADYTITKIEFTAAGNSNIDNFTASAGAIEGMTWTGNAEGVRFSQGGTSYLANAIVTLAAKDESTTALPAIEYTECANIAAFNALEAGTYAKVTLTDAEVIGKSADGFSTVWIQDATGGCWIQYTSLNDKLNEGTKVNGFVYVVARPNSGNVQMKEAEATPESELTATEISDYAIVEGTLAEVNIDANKNRVVMINGAKLEQTSANAGKLTQGDATIDVNNGSATANQQLHKIAEWTNGTTLENITIVAILVGKSATANQLLPISITENVVDGISTADAAATDAVVIYNLQGVRQQQLVKGISIVNGRKVVVK